MYKTLADLRDAYAREEITAPLVIDHGDDMKVLLHDEEWIDVTEIFRMDPCDLLMQALDLLGIPSEHG